MWRHHRSSKCTFGKLCNPKYCHSWLERNQIDWPTFAVEEEAEEVEVPRTGWLSLTLLLLLLTVNAHSEHPLIQVWPQGITILATWSGFYFCWIEKLLSDCFHGKCCWCGLWVPAQNSLRPHLYQGGISILEIQSGLYFGWIQKIYFRLLSLTLLLLTMFAGLEFPEARPVLGGH